MDCNCSNNGSSYPENLSYPQMTSQGRNPICGNNACYDELNGTGLPLAMAYVPWQQWGNLFDPGRALQVGTIFADLDMPFLGCKNTNKSQTGIFPRSTANNGSCGCQNNSNSCGRQDNNSCGCQNSGAGNNSYAGQNTRNSCGCQNNGGSMNRSGMGYNNNFRMQQRRNNNSECGRRCSGV